jgi:hypothetical protein
MLESMHGLDDQRAIERVRQRSLAGEAPGRVRVRGESGVPDDVEVIADLWNPMKAKIEVSASLFVLVLREAEEVCAGAERVFQATRDLRRSE